MTTFLTKKQREYLINEYIEQLDEFGELDDEKETRKTLNRMANPGLYQLVNNLMPEIIDDMTA